MAQDKQFEATARRKQQAREKGQAPRSRDLTSAGTLLLIAMVARGVFGNSAAGLYRATGGAWERLHEFEPTQAGLQQLLISWAAVYLRVLGPLLALTISGAVLLTFLQNGLLLSTYPLIPKLDKLNPFKSLQRFFSIQGLAETLKSLLKVVLVALVAGIVLRRHMEDLPGLGQMPSAAALRVVAEVVRELCLKTALAMVVLGAADYLYQRFEHNRSLRMSQEEMRQEVRETEGDPLVRSQLRQRREALLQDGLTAKLPQATVVLTNPTHVAVALYYREGEAPAPVVVARGQGRLAERIKFLARRYGVPVKEQPPLARALYKACPLGVQVPPALYQAVAVILAELYREAAERQRRARQGR